MDGPTDSLANIKSIYEKSELKTIVDQLTKVKSITTKYEREVDKFVAFLYQDKGHKTDIELSDLESYKDLLNKYFDGRRQQEQLREQLR